MHERLLRGGRRAATLGAGLSLAGLSVAGLSVAGLSLAAVLAACSGGSVSGGSVSGIGAASSARPATPGSTAATTVAGTVSSPVAAALAGSALPRPAHVVVVVLENHSVDKIIGNSDAPFLNGLAAGGAVLTTSFAVTHPSEPNYVALFSGSTQGIEG